MTNMPAPCTTASAGDDSRRRAAYAVKYPACAGSRLSTKH
jgi:hypothetical protein